MKKDTQRETLHTLGNLLTSISLAAELLHKEFYGPLNAQQKKYLKSILSESKKINRLIKKLPQ